MCAKRLADNRFQIPTVIDPPTAFCLTIPVPDDPLHWAALWGALHELTQGMSWADDDAHSAKQLIQVWHKALASVTLSSCTSSNAPLRGAEIEDFMPLRVDCDCNVWITCCDGTEKQLLTADQVKALLASGAVQGAPQAGAGGCANYDAQIVNGGAFLVPTPVNTGDTITITNPIGASSINSTDWYCTNGQIFFAGACVGTVANCGSCLVPTQPQGVLIIRIGSSYYAQTPNTPFTVPGGVTNVQPTILLNYPSGSAEQGKISFGVQVCNNAPATWTHVFDFTLSNGGFVQDQDFGAYVATWVPGSGWVYGDAVVAAITVRTCYLKRTFASRTLTRMDIEFDFTDGSHYQPGTIPQRLTTTASDWVHNAVGSTVTGTDKIISTIKTEAGDSEIDVFFICYSSGAGPQDGNIRIRKLTVSGLGTDPF